MGDTLVTQWRQGLHQTSNSPSNGFKANDTIGEEAGVKEFVVTLKGRFPLTDPVSTTITPDLNL